MTLERMTLEEACDALRKVGYRVNVDARLEFIYVEHGKYGRPSKLAVFPKHKVSGKSVRILIRKAHIRKEHWK